MSKTILVAALVAALALTATAAKVQEVSRVRHPRGISAALKESQGGWPQCDPNVDQFSGYFEVNDVADKNYFFWAFSARTKSASAPTILWMTGGPGCSSSLAVLIENGPCHIHESTGAMYNNTYAWNNEANIIFIDQPAGVGFSYSNGQDIDTNETMVAQDMYAFLQAFFQAHPTWSNDFFVFGESYGGHFAPATAHMVWKGNNQKLGKYINLKGGATGNGMTQPEIQFNGYYGKLAYSYCEAVLGSPCVDESTYQQMQQSVPQCLQMIQQCNENQGGCNDAFQFCAGSQLSPYEMTGRNVYDIRKPCIGSLCYPMDKIVSFMNRLDVQQALGVYQPPINWQPCSMSVNGNFGSDWVRNFDQYVQEMLDSTDGIRAMVYAGDMDFICNWYGNQAWAKQLNWSQKAAFNAATEIPLNVSGKTMAWVRSISGTTTPIKFSFVRVHDAGHMVPMDQPETILQIVNSFIFNRKF